VAAPPGEALRHSRRAVPRPGSRPPRPFWEDGSQHAARAAGARRSNSRSTASWRSSCGFHAAAPTLWRVPQGRVVETGFWAGAAVQRLPFLACGQRRLAVRVTLAGPPGPFSVTITRP